MHRSSHALRRTLIAVSAWLTACASSGSETPMPSHDASADAEAGDAAIAIPAAPPCQEGKIESCVCAAQGGVGKRACVGGAFEACGACETSFDDGRTRCVPGRYRATTRVAYRPGPAGVCGIVGPGEATVFEGEMTFTLEQTGDAEFFSVGDGCLRVPNPTNAPVDGVKNIDWRGEVVGDVNCATGELSAEIRATYFVVSVCTLGTIPTRYFAKGPFRGVYNPDVDGFEDGTVTMLEPPVLFGDPPGGSGTWSAVREQANGAEPASGPCLGDVTFDDSLFPSGDAGAP